MSSTGTTFRRYTAVFLLAILVLALYTSHGASALNFSGKGPDPANGVVYYDGPDVPELSSCSTEGIAVTAGSLDAFLQALAQQESNGNPKAHSGQSSASGKYQYISSTWAAVTAALYPYPVDNPDDPNSDKTKTSDKYHAAWDAPEPIQDAVAKLEYTQKAAALHNDYFKMALSHFYPAAVNDPSLLDTHPMANGPTPREYANQVVNKMNKAPATGIPISYNKAPGFAVYLKRIDKSAAGAPDTTPQGSGCVNTITGPTSGGTILRVPSGGGGVNVFYFNQRDLDKYNGESNYDWGGCGCLPTSTTIIQTTMENDASISPVKILNGVRAAGGVYKDGCSGVVGGALAYFVATLHYKMEEIKQEHGTLTDADLAAIKQKLNQGYIILTHSSSFVDVPGAHQTEGHFLTIYAYDKDGNFYVANPGSRGDNNKPVSPDRIKTWLDMAYAIKK